MIDQLTDLQQRGYQVLHSNGGKFDAKAQNELDNIAVEVEQNYTPHVHESITTAIHEDANFNGTNEALQNQVPKSLANFEETSKKVVEAIHGLANNGAQMDADKFVETVDALHNGTGDFAQSILTITQQMIAATCRG